MLGLLGSIVLCIWGRQLISGKKYLETKYSASSVAGVLRVSSLIKSTPMKSPEPLKEVTSLQPWSLSLPWPQPPPSPWRLWGGENWGSSESQFLLESGCRHFYPKVEKWNNADPLIHTWLVKPVAPRTLPDISNDRMLGFLLAEVLH